jgi:hypothetical protein
MKPYFLALSLLIGLALAAPSMAAPCGGDINYTFLQFNVTYRPMDAVYINLTGNNITCSNVNCTDIKVFDKNDAELVFFNTSKAGLKAWQIPLDNLTGKDFPLNDMLVMIPQNDSSYYWICYNNTHVNNTGGYIQMWFDNFERYNIGDTPTRSISASSSCTIKDDRGGKVCANNGGWFQRWLMPNNYSNVTFLLEFNTTDTSSNSHDIRIFQQSSGFSTGYRSPYSSATRVIDIRLDTTNTEIGTSMSYAPTIGKAVNWTTGREDNTIVAYFNHSRSNMTSAVDTTFMSRDAIIIGGNVAPGVWGVMSFKAWNLSIQTYHESPSITMGKPTNPTTPVTDTCTPITPLWSLNLADNCTVTGTYSIQNILIFSSGLGTTIFRNLNLTYANVSFGSFIQWATLIKDRNNTLKQA